MSTIAAGTTVGTALVSTGDTTGQLQLQVNGTTPAVTLNTAGAVGVGSTPTFGTTGQILVSGGAAAPPAWTTLASFNPAYMGYTTRNGQGTTTVLTNASTIYQVFTGTGLSNSTVQLPVTSTLSVGWVFNIRNDTIVNVLVRSSDSSLIITIPSGTSATINCVATTGTTAADWRASISDFSTYTGVGNVVLHGNATIQNPNITTGLKLNNLSGTAGQVLTSAGSGDVPTWTTPSAGAIILLSSQTVSGSTTYVTFSNVFSSTYDNYLIVFNDVAFATGYAYSGGILQAQLERNGSFVTTGYTGTHGTLNGANTANTALDIGITVGYTGRANSNAVSGTLHCFGMNSTNANIGGLIQKFLGYTTSTSVYGSQAELSSPNAVTTGIRFFVESTNTNIALGSFYVYGIKKS
jgi:hypothetical protein